MIKASELRLENLISYNGEPMPIYSIDRGGRSFYIINDIQINKNTGCTVKGGEDVFSPINITEEFLLKLGFDDTDSFNQGEYEVYLYKKGPLTLSCSSFDNKLKMSVFDNDITCEYVHQLQNLYFALTGEELTMQQRDISPS